MPATQAPKKINLYAFAKAEGFNYRTVCLVYQRWGHRTDKAPHGGTSKQIMARLREATAIAPEDCP